MRSPGPDGHWQVFSEGGIYKSLGGCTSLDGRNADPAGMHDLDDWIEMGDSLGPASSASVYKEGFIHTYLQGISNTWHRPFCRVTRKS